MNATSCIRSGVRWLAAGIGVGAGVYATVVGTTWYRYGCARRTVDSEEQDDLLDRFMPAYEVVERHHVRVPAPAGMTLQAAREMDLLESPIVRGIFKGRELILGASPDRRSRPTGLLAEVRSLGWGVLAEVPEREVIVGAVTRPWEPNVTFRAVPHDEFAAFCEPGYVKIAWTLRADAIGPTESIFRTETRAATTDATARARFRRYWAFFSPGIRLIRRATLAAVRTEAERRAHERTVGGGAVKLRGVGVR